MMKGTRVESSSEAYGRTVLGCFRDCDVEGPIPRNSLTENGRAYRTNEAGYLGPVEMLAK
jgi:hypothetical protein